MGSEYHTGGREGGGSREQSSHRSSWGPSGSGSCCDGGERMGVSDRLRRHLKGAAAPPAPPK